MSSPACRKALAVGFLSRVTCLIMPDARGFHLIVELPDDGSRQKEVYARFGLAAFKAQVFDHALVNLLTVAGTVENGMALHDIDRCFETLFKKTCGALVNDVADQSRLEAADLELCRSAVAERNRLIHGFFREHSENFMTSRGQQLMLDELGDIADLIQKADDACHRVMMRLGEPYGFTQDAVDQHLQKMIDAISSADG